MNFVILLFLINFTKSYFLFINEDAFIQLNIQNTRDDLEAKVYRKFEGKINPLISGKDLTKFKETSDPYRITMTCDTERVHVDCALGYFWIGAWTVPRRLFKSSWSLFPRKVDKSSIINCDEKMKSIVSLNYCKTIEKYHSEIVNFLRKLKFGF